MPGERRNRGRPGRAGCTTFAARTRALGVDWIEEQPSLPPVFAAPPAWSVLPASEKQSSLLRMFGEWGIGLKPLGVQDKDFLDRLAAMEPEGVIGAVESDADSEVGGKAPVSVLGLGAPGAITRTTGKPESSKA